MLANFSVRTILAGLVLLSIAPAALLAQTPPPKKESELVAAGNKPLTGQQISAMLLGNTVYFTLLEPNGNAPAGTQYIAYYRDAKTRVVGPKAGSAAFKKFEANWWTEGNQLCNEAQMIKQGNVCQSAVYKVSSDVYMCKDGNCKLLARVVPGNPEKL